MLYAAASQKKKKGPRKLIVLCGLMAGKKLSDYSVVMFCHMFDKMTI